MNLCAAGEQFRYGCGEADAVVGRASSALLLSASYGVLPDTRDFQQMAGNQRKSCRFVISFILLAYAAYLTAVYPMSRQPELSDSQKQAYRKRGYALAGTVCAMWGFGAAVISGVMFIRMYQWLTVFVLLCLCLHLRALAGKGRTGSSICCLPLRCFSDS